MNEKGKFRLFSYIIEENLLFYRSLNKNKKILAFSIFKTKNFIHIIPTLNEFLENGILTYYSIQFTIIGNSDVFFILNFEDSHRNIILKSFQLIHQTLIKNNDLTFLTNQTLEKQFFRIFIKNVSMNLKIIRNDHSIMLTNGSYKKYFNLYSINLSLLKNKTAFLHHFLNFFRDYHKKGYLIFNFKKKDNKEIILTPYFVQVGKELLGFSNIEENFNKFYTPNLLKKQNLDLSNFYCILWRNDASIIQFPYKEILEVLGLKNPQEFSDINKFNSHFEDLLRQNSIIFKKLNRNLFFIEYSSLFFIFPHLDPKLIMKLLEKYVSNYYIYIIILNEKEIDKLLKIENIKFLNNVKIIYPKNLSNFNFERLRTHIKKYPNL
jgi:hypothetical protein